MPRMIPAFEFRRRAREAMLRVLSVLVLATLIAMLPSLASNTITLMTDSDPLAAMTDLYTEERLTAMMDEDAAVAQAAMDEINAGMVVFFREKWPFIALTLAITLIFGPVLTLGLNHTLLKTLRREEISVSTVLERLPLFLKAIGLNLMTVLRTMLWSLPGTALMLLGAAVMIFVPALGLLCTLAGTVVMVVLMIRAMYRYRLATYVMADAPETGINAALRRSAQVMKGRKIELFSLEFSFMGWRLLVSMAQMMFIAMLGPVVGMTLGLFASFFLQMYVYMAEAAFYQEYAVGPLPQNGDEPADKDELI